MALSACTSGSHDRTEAARRTAQEDGTLFLREAGINPDSMIIHNEFDLPESENWETTHNRWLGMEQITALGLDELCDADTSLQPIAIIGVYPLEEQVTLVLFHQYLGDSAPLHLLTYDGSGQAIDHLNLGTCAGLNTRYTSFGARGVELAHLSFAGRLLTVSRELHLVTIQDKELWAATGTDTYEVDQRGHIMHREARAALDDMDDDSRSTRQLEALTWYSIQDEQAMDAFEAHLKAGNDPANGLELTLYVRLLAAPQSTAHWLHRHQDSPLVPVLAQWTRELRQIENDQPLLDVLKAINNPDERQFMHRVLLGK